MSSAARKSIRALIEQSRAQERRGEIGAALQSGRQALEAAVQARDLELEMEARVMVAHAQFRLGSYTATREILEPVLQHSQCQAYPEALQLLGITALEVGDMPGGERFLRQVIALSRETGNDELLARTLHNLSAGVYMPRGQFDLSLTTDAESISIYRRLAAEAHTWGPLTTMAWIHCETGRYTRLRELLAELRQVLVPGSLGEVYVCFFRAELAMCDALPEDAAAFLAHAFSLAERQGSPEGRFVARLGYSRQRRRIGDAAAALTWAADALAVAEQIGYPHLRGVALVERARACGGAAARADLHAAIDLLAPLGLEFDRARAELLLAGELLGTPEGPPAWQNAIQTITRGGFYSLLALERPLALQLLAAYPLNAQPLLERLARIPPAPLEVQTLGGLRAQVGRQVLDKAILRRRGAGELLALLLLSPEHSLAYEQIAEALCPEKEPSAARMYVQHAISTLRRALEPDLPDRRFPSRYLDAGEGRLELCLPPGSRLDFMEFEAACSAADWNEALQLWRGEFLPEYRYADWAIQKREVLGGLLRRALLAQIEAQYARGELQAALDSAERLLAEDAWNERATWVAMRAAMALGDVPGALRRYRRLEETLRAELGISPGAELQALRESCSTGYWL